MNILLPYQAGKQLDMLLQEGRQLDSGQALAKGALLLALECGETFELGLVCEELIQLASDAAHYVKPDMAPTKIAEQLCSFFKDIKGFKGNTEDYYNPENSYLNRLLEYRQGIPISLAILYLSVASSLGIKEIKGVGFPGHFLLKVGEEEPILIDPYYHKLISYEDCEDRIKTLFGKHAHLHRSYFLTVSNRELLSRMARNLVEVFKKREEYETSLLCCSRAILAEPGIAEDYYIRAQLFQRLECYEAAIQDYTCFVNLAPRDERVLSVRKEISALKEQQLKPRFVH